MKIIVRRRLSAPLPLYMDANDPSLSPRLTLLLLSTISSAQTLLPVWFYHVIKTSHAPKQVSSYEFGAVGLITQGRNA